MGNPFGSGSSGDEKKPDGVTTEPANGHDLQSYVDASRQLSELSAPVLLSSANPHERIYIAAFDGTGNDVSKDEASGHMTNVALIRRQILQAYPNTDDPIRVGYVEGPGTQDGFIARTFDGARGYTYEPRLERMYEQLERQAAQWLKDDPDAQIRVVSIGFSRGAEQAAGFSRLVDERGIQDVTGIRRTRNDDGERVVEYTRPALVAPNQVVQAVGLFDPVGTGVPRDYDRRLPPSVISGFQITAEDERRNQFKSTNIIDPGFQERNHFLSVTVGGAHSDVGGSYLLNGLAIRSNNLMTDYLNSLSEKPFLQKQAVPTDPAMNVVHHSEEHLFIYRTSDFEKNEGRVRIEEVAPRSVARTGVAIDNKEQRNDAMAQAFQERRVPIASEIIVPANPAQSQIKLDPTQPAHPDHALYRQGQEAVGKLDQSMGRAPDAASDRMAASLTVLAKQEGLQRIDTVVLSRNTDATKAGENVIVVQGKLDDPSHLRAHMKTQTAIETTVAESFKQLDQANGQQKTESMQLQNPQSTRDVPTLQIASSMQEDQRQSISR
ncbi:MAG: XVIPCD domain-containing protein [Arenimonas sp.]